MTAAVWPFDAEPRLPGSRVVCHPCSEQTLAAGLLFHTCSHVSRPRVIISGKQPAVVIGVWLRKVPDWVWGEEPGYARLKKEKRHNPLEAPDPRLIVATHVAGELERLSGRLAMSSRRRPDRRHRGAATDETKRVRAKGGTLALGPKVASRLFSSDFQF
jgi:hypothetical protein